MIINKTVTLGMRAHRLVQTECTALSLQPHRAHATAQACSASAQPQRHQWLQCAVAFNQTVHKTAGLTIAGGNVSQTGCRSASAL